MSHKNLILQLCRRITFFLQHMGAKRIEIDVEVKAIFPQKNSLGYDEDSDNGGMLVRQTIQFQSGIGLLKKVLQPHSYLLLQFEFTRITRNNT